MADLSRPMLNKIGEEIKHKFPICMHAMSATLVRSNKFSSYNDLKVDLT